ncbi:hypothetical protein KGM_212362 [Danaus plexippus plexippus]|uniref:Uncharacterized protein n=1 Tax=Danaus plexippus plexippus TaxID=278856 RepID=A0A212FLS2_DANPL|nr:hypothetical protein KGM_212362 [Danaus plexippus plexippus]
MGVHMVLLVATTFGRTEFTESFDNGKRIQLSSERVGNRCTVEELGLEGGSG